MLLLALALVPKDAHSFLRPLPSAGWHRAPEFPYYSPIPKAGTGINKKGQSILPRIHLLQARNVNANANDKSHKNDSLQSLEQDVAHVLKVLRSEENDPTLPKPYHTTKKERRLPAFTKPWTVDDWAVHTSRWRYFDYLRSFPQSRLLQRILPHLLLLCAWSTGCVWALEVRPKKLAILSKIGWTMAPLSLVSTFVFALETLRSNQGLSRLNEGRTTFGKHIYYARDMAGLIAASVYPKHKYLGLKMTRHVALYGWMIRRLVRGEPANGTDEDMIRTMLSPPDADYLLRQRNAPVAIVARLRQVMAFLAEEGHLTTAEELAMDHTTKEMIACVATAERIVSTPIPVLYTAHLGRLLIVYLLLLPLVLRGTNTLNGIATVVTTTAVGYAMLGLDEISHILEQPFKFMPLYQLSKKSMEDVADALVCVPPSLETEEEEEGGDNNEAVTVITSSPPAYW